MMRSVALILLLAALACDDGTTNVELPPATIPDVLGDGWAVASMVEHDIDPAQILGLSARIEQGEYKHVHSLLIARGGELVFEEYYREHHQDSVHTLQSVTKSVGATLIGIAIDQGVLDLDATLPEMLPSRAEEIALDPDKSLIRLRDLLSMRAGLEWDEWTCSYLESDCNSNILMKNSDDWVSYVLSQPVVETPGTHFVYNSGASNLLAAILQDATGQHPTAFAEDYLFGPLQIEDYRWFRNGDHPDGLPHFGGGLRLKSRDLAKLGQLYLDGGRWGGQQVVSAGWVEQATTTRAQVSGSDYYGFQWWLRPLTGPAGHQPTPNDVWFGWGFGEQHVFAIPLLDLVVAVNSWNEDGSTTVFQIMGATSSMTSFPDTTSSFNHPVLVAPVNPSSQGDLPRERAPPSTSPRAPPSPSDSERLPAPGTRSVLPQDNRCVGTPFTEVAPNGHTYRSHARARYNQDPTAGGRPSAGDNPRWPAPR